MITYQIGLQLVHSLYLLKEVIEYDNRNLQKKTTTTNSQHFAKTNIKVITHVLKRYIKLCA